MKEVKYRAVDYEIVNQTTGKIAFRCLECDRVNVYIARTSDGKRCQFCDGAVVPLGYVRKKRSF